MCRDYLQLYHIGIILFFAHMSAPHQSILEYTKQYVSLTPEEEQFFVSVLRHKKIRKRQYLIQAGDVCRFENFVIKGCLRAFYVHHDEEHVVQFAVENWWTSDLSSFITGKEASLNIDALEDSEVWQISRDDMEQLYLRVPKFEHMFRILLQNAFVALQERTIQNLSMTAKERYLLFTAKYPSLEQRIPQVHIASFLGMTPEFLSKIRKQLASGNEELPS